MTIEKVKDTLQSWNYLKDFDDLVYVVNNLCVNAEDDIIAIVNNAKQQMTNLTIEQNRIDKLKSNI